MAEGKKRIRAGSCTVAILAVLAIGTCAAICGITALHLQNVSVSVTEMTASAEQCVLGTTGSVNNLCTVAYISAGIGAGLALVMLLVACITCRCCGWGHIFDFVIGIIATAWMAAFGVFFLITANQEQNSSLPEGTWRFAVWLCFFIGAGIFAILTCASFVLMFAACCCRGKKEKPVVADLEAQQKPLDPYAPQDTATYGDQAPAQTYAYPTTLAPAQQVV